jgi:hypothetical protein
MLPVNDAILLDKTKPDEFQFIANKNANLVAMNLLTVMLCDTDAMIILKLFCKVYHCIIVSAQKSCLASK